MLARVSLVTSLVAATLAVVMPASASTAPTPSPAVVPADSSGAIIDRNPTTRILDAAKRHTEFFTVTFDAEAGESRFVSTSLVVKDAKGTKPSELFLGVTLSCTSPSGAVTQSEAGRNVWPAAPNFSIPVYLKLQTDVAGSYTCDAEVMMCDPGNCSAPTGTGKVKIITRKMDPREHSYLLVSGALPAWAQAEQVPSSGDQLIQTGRSGVFTGSFDLMESSEDVELGALLSITNCIEASYPDACSGAKKFKANGSATITLALTARQLPTESGVTCSTMSASSSTGAGKDVITWQQHHAVATIWIKDFAFSDAPGCGNSVEVQVTVKSLKGNSVVVEPGKKVKWSSLVYAVPVSATL